jgi:peptidoglycan lytic transglycosylase
VKTRFILALGVLGLVFVVSCARSPEQSRYAEHQDSAPLKSISADEVADAIPRPDPILKAGNKSPYKVRGVTYKILDNYQDYSEEGIASWYGAKFNGYETSNGEIFDLYQPTAAHKTLPIPSYVRVTNLQNGRSVVVRVNDRGPFHQDRIIDLSYAAAVKLGYMDKGTAHVRVEVVPIEGTDDRRDASFGDYRFLQLGAFSSESSAQRLQGELQPLVSAPVVISPVQSNGARLYRVRVGPVDDKAHLETVRQTLVARGYDPGQPLP